MQQRRLRLGDILDDYCPRERRITNHAVVAMIEDEVKQTRCTTCDSDHEYKQAKVPPPRRPKPTGALLNEGTEGALQPRPVPVSTGPSPVEELEPPAELVEAAHVPPLAEEASPPSGEEASPPSAEDEGPVHRRLIRATLPRPEGQPPDRKAPDFTIRQPGGRGREFDPNRNGNRHRRNRHGKPTQGSAGGGQSSSRFSGTRHGGVGSGNPHAQRHGNRPGSGGQRGGRPPGQGRGPRQGSGPGRKRGR